MELHIVMEHVSSRRFRQVLTSLRVFTYLICLFGFIIPATVSATPVSADFNGDGYEDLVVGVPGEDVGGINNAGAVQVFYGSPAGDLGTSQIWHLNSPNIQLNATRGDRMGSAITTGDFNGDGFTDLAVGIPFKDNRQGQVLVLYGSRSGLTAAGNQVWNQDKLEDSREDGDEFGSALATGDFNADGYADLAIGVPKEDFPDEGPVGGSGPVCGICANAGIVNVVYGSPTGLTANHNELWHQDRGSADGWVEWQDCFGTSVASGDFNGDGADDLAVGAVCEHTGGGDLTGRNFGAVSVYKGTRGGGLSGAGAVYLRQFAAGVAGFPKDKDAFGFALAVGDFNNDNKDDLAIGVPGEEADCSDITDAGAVAVFYGKAVGVGLSFNDASRNELWCRNSSGIQGSGDGRWGYALAAGDFDADGFDDVAVGAPLDTIEGITEAGSVSVLYGSAARLTRTGNQLFTQNTAGVLDIAESYDWFGHTLTAVDFNGNGIPDLAIGVPFENIEGKKNAGVVNLLFGSRGIGISFHNNRLIQQNSPGSPEKIEVDDEFGGRLVPQLYGNPWPNKPPEGVDNQAPKWKPISPQTVQEGEQLSIIVSATDKDGPDPMVLTATDLPTGASFNDEGDGSGEMTWTPQSGTAADSPYTVTFTATDDGGDGSSSDMTVTINVLPQPQAPRLDPIDSQTVIEGQLLVFQITASDADGPPPLVLSVNNAPGNSSFADFGDGSGEFRWTPISGSAANSPYVVTFTATDNGGSGLSDSTTVDIEVQAPSNDVTSDTSDTSDRGGGGCTIGSTQSREWMLPLLVVLGFGYFTAQRKTKIPGR